MATEQQIQSECFLWHWNTYPLERRMLFHIDNNSSDRRTGNLKKAQGVVRGVSDFIIVINGLVIFIEMKTEIGSQSTHQVVFERMITERGHIYKLVRSVQEFKDLIIRLYEAIKD